VKKDFFYAFGLKFIQNKIKIIVFTWCNLIIMIQISSKS